MGCLCMVSPSVEVELKCMDKEIGSRAAVEPKMQITMMEMEIGISSKHVRLAYGRM